MQVLSEVTTKGPRVFRNEDSAVALSPDQDVGVRRAERKIGRVAHPDSVNGDGSARAGLADRVPDWLASKILIKHEADGHRSGIPPSLLGHSLFDQLADTKLGRAWRVFRMLAFQLGPVVCHVRINSRPMLAGEGDDLVNQV